MSNTDFYSLPATGEDELLQFRFGAGESHVRLTSQPSTDVRVFYRYQGDASVMQLLLLTDALRRAGAVNIELIMPYLPGARQDRVCNVGEPLSTKVYAQVINSQQFRKVYVFDPHSDVGPALLDNVQVIKNHAFIKDVLRDVTTDYVLISPDAGANKKVFELSAVLGGAPVVRADKLRDVRNGRITATEVFAESLHGDTCVIVDDICAGGRTFIELAKKLKEKGAEKVILIVSHYEGTADEELLLQSGIDRVVCTDSLLPQDSKLVDVRAVSSYMNVQGEIK